jgi:hypothetical protein
MRNVLQHRWILLAVITVAVVSWWLLAQPQLPIVSAPDGFGRPS